MPKHNLPSIEYSHPFSPNTPQFTLLLQIYDVMRYSYLVWNDEVKLNEEVKESSARSGHAKEEKAKKKASGGAKQQVVRTTQATVSSLIAKHASHMQETLESLSSSEGTSFRAVFKRMPIAFRLSLQCHNVTSTHIRQFLRACLAQETIDYVSFQILDRKYISMLKIILNEMQEDLGETRVILTLDARQFSVNQLRLFTYFHDFHGFNSDKVHFEFLYPQLEEHATLFRELFMRCDMLPKDLILWSNGTLNWQETLSPEERSCKLSTLLHQKNHQPRPLLSGRLLKAAQERKQKQHNSEFSEDAFVPVFGDDSEESSSEHSDDEDRRTSKKKKRALDQKAPNSRPQKKAKLNSRG
eukprot:CAMPEP_0117440910 /NCGR_PEP_ID=MMETSP0759-20121206/3344_1 /TAXON_ID=63605 /ORGANISM="Percolomonas cosmopolitus, Strain WS" /LENGTH=354 /DNA_ID=CAMNT_0005232711 /DNA_START=54 /DNA_END=1114 /DNA_ORIENTATION=+